MKTKKTKYYEDEKTNLERWGPTFIRETLDQNFKLVGFIAGDTFGSRGGSHFAHTDGNVVCGTKNRFGMDCVTEIRILDYDNFETDQIVKFNKPDKMNLRRNHLPMYAFVTCKKCQNKIKKLLETATVVPIVVEEKPTQTEFTPVTFQGGPTN